MNLPETTIFVTTIGDETNFADCMAHLRSQTVQRPIEVIDHVAPMSLALQQMHVRCTTAFYVQVDEDMILLPDAIAKLEMMIREASGQVAMICAPLWDCDTDQPIYGLKIYRHEIVRQFPYQDSLSCETQQLGRIQAAGFEIELLPLTDRSGCVGEHGKHYSPETIFRRWQRLFHKHEQLGHRAWIEPWAEKLLDRYIVSKDKTHLYAFLGAVAGIAGDPAADRELDFREANRALSRITRYFPIQEKSENA